LHHDMNTHTVDKKMRCRKLVPSLSPSINVTTVLNRNCETWTLGIVTQRLHEKATHGEARECPEMIVNTVTEAEPSERKQISGSGALIRNKPTPSRIIRELAYVHASKSPVLNLPNTATL
ncbi:hypothetical protein STEG23_004150, partial [Scotinomys teguina]